MNYIMLANDIFTQPWFIILILVAFFGLVVLGVILIKKYVINRNTKKEPLDEKKIREEELNRVLEPITDEKAIKEMEDLKDQHKKDNEGKHPNGK